MKGIYRLGRSSLYAKNPGSGHDDEIALYDSAFEKVQNLSRILAHEFAHKMYSQLSDEDALSYIEKAEWLPTKDKKGKSVLVLIRDFYVEADAPERVDEDFSNNIEYFLFNPELLKAKSPKVFDWIQKKYGDKFKVGRPNKK